MKKSEWKEPKAILRGLLFSPLIYGGKIITFIGLVCGASWYDAKMFWIDSWV